MMNDRPCQSTVIRRHSENEFWFDFFFENCRTTLRQCLTWSDKVPTTFWEYSYNNRRRSTTLTLSSLQWIDTVLVLCTVVWKFTIIFEKFISNNCVVFIPKALHLIHLIFDIFLINVIIETSRKKKVDEKTWLFVHFWLRKSTKNFQKQLKIVALFILKPCTAWTLFWKCRNQNKYWKFVLKNKVNRNFDLVVKNILSNKKTQ